MTHWILILYFFSYSNPPTITTLVLPTKEDCVRVGTAHTQVPDLKGPVLPQPTDASESRKINDMIDKAQQLANLIIQIRGIDDEIDRYAGIMSRPEQRSLVNARYILKSKYKVLLRDFDFD